MHIRQEPATKTEEHMTSVTSSDRSRIAFEKTGSGPALIIVNGALSHRKMYGDTALQRMLAQHFTTYTYDRRGRGEPRPSRCARVDRLSPRLIFPNVAERLRRYLT